MASKGLSQSLKVLRLSYGSSKDPLMQCLQPRLSRTMATATHLPSPKADNAEDHPSTSAGDDIKGLPPSSILTTIYRFPSMEPLRFESYPAKHLYLPLRRDILHRAVIFEGDMTRQGTASSKTRYEVHGSHRKIRPQKGSGSARLGTRQSPSIRGGGKTFGPHPRDFATGLPRKIYDLAWRTALSYRYRKGELIVCEDGMEIESAEGGFVREVFRCHRWGNEWGRSLVVTMDHRERLFEALGRVGDHGRALRQEQVDVKDLLEMGRIIIEKKALDRILEEHQRDLVSTVATAL